MFEKLLRRITSGRYLTKKKMETQYLKDHLGFLPQCLKEVVERRPHDPIEYIAHWLKKHVENEKYKQKKEEEARQLEKELELEELEKENRARRLEETLRFAEEEAARLKAKEERKAKEAASASKLPIVEEKEEPVTETHTEADNDENSSNLFGDIKEEDETKAEEEMKEIDTKEEEGESAEQETDKFETDDVEEGSPEETSGAAED
ncbi:DPY30 domain-containing protein 1 [Biomphalaria glabrata]|nr:DPY30 domain-containing protein 1-like [Biomphalaria glabrata]